MNFYFNNISIFYNKNITFSFFYKINVININTIFINYNYTCTYSFYKLIWKKLYTTSNINLLANLNLKKKIIFFNIYNNFLFINYINLKNNNSNFIFKLIPTSTIFINFIYKNNFFYLLFLFKNFFRYSIYLALTYINFSKKFINFTFKNKMNNPQKKNLLINNHKITIFNTKNLLYFNFSLL